MREDVLNVTLKSVVLLCREGQKCSPEGTNTFEESAFQTEQGLLLESGFNFCPVIFQSHMIWNNSIHLAEAYVFYLKIGIVISARASCTMLSSERRSRLPLLGRNCPHWRHHRFVHLLQYYCCR